MSGRGVGAVFAGVLVNFALSLGSDGLLHGFGVFPPWGQAMGDGLFVLALSYRLVYGVAGGWTTARLAPARPMAHALSLGGVGLSLCLVATVAMWNSGPEFGPHWYAVALAASAIPCSWLGARIYRA